MSAVKLAALLNRGEYEGRVKIVGRNLIELELFSVPPPSPSSPPVKYDNSWANRSPKTPEDKAIHWFSIAERRRLKAEAKLGLRKKIRVNKS